MKGRRRVREKQVKYRDHEGEWEWVLAVAVRLIDGTPDSRVIGSHRQVTGDRGQNGH